MNPSSKLEAALESTGLNQEQKDKIRDAYKEDLRRQTDNIGDMIDAFKEKLNKNNTEALKKTRKEVTKQMWNNNRIDLEREKENLAAEFKKKRESDEKLELRVIEAVDTAAERFANYRLGEKCTEGDVDALKALAKDIYEHMKAEMQAPLFIVTVTYQHDMDVEDRKIYIGRDPEKAKRAFMNYQELWCKDQKVKFQNPFKYKESNGYFEGAKYLDDEITGKQADEMLSDALDEAIANKHDYTIQPEDIGEELDFNNSPCSLEVIVGDYETYGGV